jgi:chromate transporter
MEDEVVGRRAWLDRATFFDLVGASNLLPGPSSTEMALHLGYQRAGLAGLLAAGVSFIAPAAVMTTVLASCWRFSEPSWSIATAGSPTRN